MFTPTKRTPLARRFLLASISPFCSARQGPHQEAQKFSTAGWPRKPARSKVPPATVGPLKAGRGTRRPSGTTTTFAATARTWPVPLSGARPCPPPPARTTSTASTATSSVADAPSRVRRGIGLLAGGAENFFESNARRPRRGRRRRLPRMRACASSRCPDTGVDLRGKGVVGLTGRCYDAAKRVTAPSRSVRRHAGGRARRFRPAREGRAHGVLTTGTALEVAGVACSTEGRGPALVRAGAADAGAVGRALHHHGRGPVVVAVLRRRHAEVDQELHPQPRLPQAGDAAEGDPRHHRGDLVRAGAGRRWARRQGLQPAQPESAALGGGQAGGDRWLQVARIARGSLYEPQQAEHPRRL